MKKLFKRLRAIKGFTYIEVMIALGMLGIVTTAVFKVYINQHENYITQDDITTIQQNARASIDEISRNVRMAGYDLPDGLEAIEIYNTNPDTIVLNYRIDGCDTYLSSAMPQPSSELKCGTNVSCFEDDQWVYIFEPDSGGGEWFVITHVQEAALHIQHNTMSLSKSYGKDAILLSMHQVKFFVDNTTNPDHPSLMVHYMGQTPQVYAEDIEDLQFQCVMKNGVVVDEPVLIDNIREIKIAITGRSSRPQVDYVYISPGGDVDSTDHFRRRSFSTSVNVRNLGS